jgi:hypothetical protein
MCYCIEFSCEWVLTVQSDLSGYFVEVAGTRDPVPVKVIVQAVVGIVNGLDVVEGKLH